MLDEIKAAIAEVQQPRSRFQLEHFVLGQHATPEMQYYQTCIELQDMLYKYETVKLDVQITEEKINELRAKGDKISELKAQKKELGLEQTKVVMLGHERELAHLVDIWKSFDHRFTRDELEAAQPEYWKQRLVKGANAMIMGGGGVNASHLEAMEQAGILEQFIQEKIEVENNEVRNLES